MTRESETQATMKETNATLTRVAELLGKARLGQNIESVNLTLETEPSDPDELLRTLWRRLDDLRMADLGRTDPLGPG